MPLTEQFPDSPAGRHAQWFLGAVVSRGVDVTLEEVAEHMALPAPWTPVEGLERLRAGEWSNLRVAMVVAPSTTEIDVTLDDGGGSTANCR